VVATAGSMVEREDDAVALTAGELNRATLARQLLLERAPVGADDAVRQVLALQAQSPASSYLALWNRVVDLDPAEIDRAYLDATLVRATLLRITLHTVHAADHAVAHQAMQPTLRAARLGDRRFTDSGLTAADADALVPEVLHRLAEPRTNAEMETWLDQRGLPGRPLWWALRHYAPVRHAVTGGAWSFEHRPRYVAADLPPPTPGDREAADEALAALVRRYLTAFGPATVADVAQFALVQRARVKVALARLGDEVERLAGPDGAELLDVPGAPQPPAEVTAPPRLLGMWDNVLLAYHDRGRILPPEHRTLVTRRNGDVLPTLLVDGKVAGVWRPVEGAIEATAFHPLPAEAWTGLADEARSLLAVLADRDPQPYARHAHWWAKLPDLERRLLR
jgi:hypothetical protein